VIYHRTTKEHYEKYRDLAKRAHVTLLNGNGKFLGISNTPCEQALAGARDETRVGAIVGCMGCWLCMYRIDQSLNSVPLKKWDMLVWSFWDCQGRKIITNLGDGICMYKHLVIFEILGATPVFHCPICKSTDHVERRPDCKWVNPGCPIATVLVW